jgi:membrane-bound metal-dependent hydrolase YbcI (DUF457 family)
MANFNAHIAVGAIASGLGATVALAAGLAQPTELLTLTSAGIIGSVLPDIDLDKSGPSRFLFDALGVIMAFGALFHFHDYQFSLVELWLIWITVYLLMRYGLWHVFMNYSVHRGVWHSLLAGVFFWTLSAAIFATLFGKEPASAWLGGFFVFYGYVVHLVLDEIYAVDFEDAHIKKSFGTALKLFDYRSAVKTGLMAASVAGAFYLAPSFRPFAETVKSARLSAFMHERLLPKGRWFKFSSAAKTNRTAQEAVGSVRTSGQ